MQPLHAKNTQLFFFNHATYPPPKNIQPLRKKSTQPLHQKITQPLHKKITQPPQKKTQKSCNLSTQEIMQSPRKIKQPQQKIV